MSKACYSQEAQVSRKDRQRPSSPEDPENIKRSCQPIMINVTDLEAQERALRPVPQQGRHQLAAHWFALPGHCLHPHMKEFDQIIYEFPPGSKFYGLGIYNSKKELDGLFKSSVLGRTFVSYWNWLSTSFLNSVNRDYYTSGSLLRLETQSHSPAARHLEWEGCASTTSTLRTRQRREARPSLWKKREAVSFPGHRLFSARGVWRHSGLGVTGLQGHWGTCPDASHPPSDDIRNSFEEENRAKEWPSSQIRKRSTLSSPDISQKSSKVLRNRITAPKRDVALLTSEEKLC